jgi:hypothetical protein
MARAVNALKIPVYKMIFELSSEFDLIPKRL